MKKSLVILIGILIIVMAYGVWQTSRSPEVDLAPIAAICAEEGGTWLADHKECENIGVALCVELGGAYDGCTSACRHNPDVTAPCTMQCVPVCSFSG